MRSAYALDQTSFKAKSGAPTEVACQSGGHWRVDANGKEWPVTIQYITRPKNGTVTTRVSTGSVSLHGQTRTVHLTRVVYQSRKGFAGEDSFTYRRTTADPTDPLNGHEYTVAVTVKLDSGHFRQNVAARFRSASRLHQEATATNFWHRLQNRQFHSFGGECKHAGKSWIGQIPRGGGCVYRCPVFIVRRRLCA